MPPQPSPLQTAVDTLTRLLPPCGGVLVALSGGPDSVLLLRAAVVRRDASGGTVEAAHLHHGLRGTDADADASFCAELCASLDVPLHVHRLTWPSGAAPGEAALRDARRAFLLDELGRRPHLAAIATGHQADDQAETLIMRLFRGTGPDGLAGIPARDGPMVRPLLSLTRKEVEMTLAALDQPARHDPTNHGDANLRARLRRDLRPVLDALFGDAAVQGPVRTAGVAARDAGALDQLADIQLAAWRRDGEPDDALPLPEAASLPDGLLLRVVRRMVAQSQPGPSPLTEARLSALAAWLPSARSGSTLELSEGWRVEREADRLRIRRGKAPPPSPPHLRITPGLPSGLDPRAPETGLDPPGGRWRLAVPSAALHGVPRLRAWRPGDRFQPFGLDGHKKVSDFLQEARVPRTRRGDVWLVEDDAGPLWLVGLARAERTRWLPPSGEAVTLTVDSREHDPPSGRR